MKRADHHKGDERDYCQQLLFPLHRCGMTSIGTTTLPRSLDFGLGRSRGGGHDRHSGRGKRQCKGSSHRHHGNGPMVSVKL